MAELYKCSNLERCSDINTFHLWDLRVDKTRLLFRKFKTEVLQMEEQVEELCDILEEDDPEEFEMDQHFELKLCDIYEVTWMLSARSKIMFGFHNKDGQIHNFRGFNKEAQDWLVKYFKECGIPTRQKERNVTGRNWGSLNIEGNMLSLVDESNKELFQVAVNNLTSIKPTGENDVTLKFHVDDTHDEKDSLVEMGSYIPDSSPEFGGEDVTPSMAFKAMLASNAYVRTGSEESIFEFRHVLTVAPGGVHDLSIHQKFFKLQRVVKPGEESCVVTILYNKIISIHLLPKTERYTYVVISLESPLTYGPNAQYRHVVIQLNSSRHVEKSVSLEKVPAHQALIEMLEIMTEKESLGPGDFVASDGVSHYIQTSIQDSENVGCLYPLDNAFLYLNVPVTQFHHDKILEVAFELSDQMFNLVFTEKKGQAKCVFRSIRNTEYENIFNYMRSKGIKVKDVDGDDAYKSKGFHLYSNNRLEELMAEYPKRTHTSIQKEIKDGWDEMQGETQDFNDIIG